MHIAPFGVEIWMNEWETKCDLNLAETCVESLTIAQLLDLAERNHAELSELLPMNMTYRAIEGSDRLRDAIAALYERQARENVLVTHGTIGANSLVHQALVGQGIGWWQPCRPTSSTPRSRRASGPTSSFCICGPRTDSFQNSRNCGRWSRRGHD